MSGVLPDLVNTKIYEDYLKNFGPMLAPPPPVVQPLPPDMFWEDLLAPLPNGMGIVHLPNPYNETLMPPITPDGGLYLPTVEKLYR